jgi:hypothetical protein
MRQKASILLGVLFVAYLTLSATPALLTLGFSQRPPGLANYNIYFTDSHGEASRYDRSAAGLSRLRGLLEELNAELYTVEWNTRIPDDADLVIVAGPTLPYTPSQVVRLWSYVNRGGRLLILADSPLPPNASFTAGGDLFDLFWINFGLRGRDDVVATEHETFVIETLPEDIIEDNDGENDIGEPLAEDAEEEGTGPIFAHTLIDYFLTAHYDTDHPITTRLDGRLFFSGARSLEVQTLEHVPQVFILALTDDDFYGETDFGTYMDMGFATYNLIEDTPRMSLALAAAVADPATQARVVFIGNRDFATNGGGLQVAPLARPAFIYPDNARFMLNSIAWLLEVDAGNVDFNLPSAANGSEHVLPTPTPFPTLPPTG